MVNQETSWVCINCEIRVELKTSFAKNLEDYKENCDENGCKLQDPKL